ncbi:hypothetical protein MADA3029_1000006 [Vibrio nigripulchritudo MADA3029]|uniref:Uncharacterized protein n=1 Tax=Vibrio nigripulchritudo SOn1 TaxID=1238450 RepID=A0AAV2VHX8_9VIBR|nr:hypothetical protein VIBNIFTn2_700003 [Vibrio nigripulchritudo FTn2]CCN47407.1 hypothetical protein VIBNIMADA3020_380007 [Vibrio nigripulchritudo MADA3020]CCN55008.1 hypothetical protein VIBNIMADA3021_650006 [Vibrio nigripulchritudo MADA3021]CCN56795.1 hypothetical protein MADA3029_1000006 [Vibrio nigripulchritudo MADA3029]CCN64246.1 hypothetical protein VIBNIPon4_200003 [Vibrio nigripulchritudo POn4]CCN79021.1 hypothetical protein VIBNISO65_800003 [Vibrio nigripulchritudo SO65]CCN90525.1 
MIFWQKNKADSVCSAKFLLLEKKGEFSCSHKQGDYLESKHSIIHRS